MSLLWTLPASTVAVLVIACLLVAPASGHGGEVGIEVIPPRAPAGDTVFVYGEELEPGSRVEVNLHAADGVRHIGTFDVDEDGHVIQEVAVPSDLPPRIYELQLTMASGETVSAYLTVMTGQQADPAAGEGPASGAAIPLVGGLLLVAALVLLAGWLASSRLKQRAG